MTFRNVPQFRTRYEPLRTCATGLNVTGVMLSESGFKEWFSDRGCPHGAGAWSDLEKGAEMVAWFLVNFKEVADYLLRNKGEAALKSIRVRIFNLVQKKVFFEPEDFASWRDDDHHPCPALLVLADSERQQIFANVVTPLWSAVRPLCVQTSLKQVERVNQVLTLAGTLGTGWKKPSVDFLAAVQGFDLAQHLPGAAPGLITAIGEYAQAAKEALDFFNSEE